MPNARTPLQISKPSCQCIPAVSTAEIDALRLHIDIAKNTRYGHAYGRQDRNLLHCRGTSARADSSNDPVRGNNTGVRLLYRSCRLIGLVLTAISQCIPAAVDPPGALKSLRLIHCRGRSESTWRAINHLRTRDGVRNEYHRTAAVISRDVTWRRNDRRGSQPPKLKRSCDLRGVRR